jgi:hypothetical protein
MTPESKDLLRSARTTLSDVVLPALADPFALEQLRTVLRVLTHLEAVVDEAYPIERETADDLARFLAGVAQSLDGDEPLAELRGAFQQEPPLAPDAVPPLAELRAASSRRKGLVTALVRGPLRDRRGTEWERATRAALGDLVRRQLVRDRRWMSPKPGAPEEKPK